MACFGCNKDGLSVPLYWLFDRNLSVNGRTLPIKKQLQYIPRNMHTGFALLCFVVVIHWLIFPYPSGLLHWHCGNLTIAPMPAKQPWWIWIDTSCEFIMNDCITTTKQSTTKPCAYFLGYTVCGKRLDYIIPDTQWIILLVRNPLYFVWYVSIVSKWHLDCYVGNIIGEVPLAPML